MRLAFATLALIVALAICDDVPKSFDAREKWKECITPILNQGQCGSCWSFAASTSMSARLCIASGGKISPFTVLSPQYLVSCDTDDQSGCHGGDTLAAYNFMQGKGQDSLNCTKYTSGDTSTEGQCPTACDDGRPIDDKQLFFGVDHYSLVVPGDNAATTAKIQQDLMKNGPLSVSFVVYSSFMSFFKQNPKGIYKTSDNVGKAMGGHAVRLVGFGEEEGVKFWTIANSWGESWGHDGYFRIERGADLCQIESRRVTAGIPKIGRNQINSKPSRVDTLVIDGGKVKVAVDQEILEIAKFSLAEMQSKKIPNSPSAFFGVEEAYAQVTNGITYHLKLSVGKGRVNNSNLDGAAPASSIDVVVHRNPHDKLALKSH